MNIDIVIVNWNSGTLIRECVRSIPNGPNVFVVDNASRDGSADNLPCSVIRNSKNLGFARACNIGAKLGDSDYILFLNPDTRVSRESLVIPLNAFRAHKRVGVVGIKLVGDSGTQRNCARVPSLTSMLAHTLGLDRFIPAFGYVMKNWDHESDRLVNHVIGAFYMIRRSLFESLGGFDEDYFVFLEDLDLSLRVRRAGYFCLYLAAASAYHKGGGTTRQLGGKRLELARDSRKTFCRKHFPRRSRAIAAIAFLAEKPLRAAYQYLIRAKSVP